MLELTDGDGLSGEEGWKARCLRLAAELEYYHAREERRLQCPKRRDEWQRRRERALAIYQMAAALSASFYGLDAAVVACPRERRARACSSVQRACKLAIYMTVCVGEPLPGLVGDAVGLRRQTVAGYVRDVLADRDDADLDAAYDGIEADLIAAIASSGLDAAAAA